MDASLLGTAMSLGTPVLSAFDSPGQVLTILRSVHRDEQLQWIRKLHDLALLAAYFGDPELALTFKAEEMRDYVNRMTALWYPVMSEARQLPQFKLLAEELGLVRYWRSYGWADHCRPLGEDDFECT